NRPLARIFKYRLSSGAECLGDVGKGRFLRIADANATKAEEGTLHGGLRHFLADAAQPILEGSCVARRLGIENCRNLPQSVERALDAVGRLGAGKVLAKRGLNVRPPL